MLYTKRKELCITMFFSSLTNMLRRAPVLVLVMALQFDFCCAQSICSHLQHQSTTANTNTIRSGSAYLSHKLSANVLEHETTYKKLIPSAVDTNASKLVYNIACNDSPATTDSVAFTELTKHALIATIADRLSGSPTDHGLAQCMHPRDPILAIDEKIGTVVCSCGRANCDKTLCNSDLIALGTAVFVVLQFLYLRGTYYNAK